MNRRTAVGAKQVKGEENRERKLSPRASVEPNGAPSGADRFSPVSPQSQAADATARARALARWENEGGRVVLVDHRPLRGA